MTTIDTIYDRRAIRDYTRARVTASAVDELLSAAVQAPSSLNQQPWSFAVFQGESLLADFSRRAKINYLRNELPVLGYHERGDTLTDDSYNIFYNATTLLVIYAVPGSYHGIEDCCLAAQNVMLAAHVLGLGTCPIGIARPWLNLPEIKEELGVPVQHTAAFAMTLGYPGSQPTRKTRRAPDVVQWMLPTD